MKCRIEGVGTYRIVLNTGYCLDLEKCLYVPDCSRNLVSISRLDILGFDFRIGHGCFHCIMEQIFIVLVRCRILYIVSI